MRENRTRYVVEAAPFELLVETLQEGYGDLARQWMIFAEDARRSPVGTPHQQLEVERPPRLARRRVIRPVGSPALSRPAGQRLTGYRACGSFQWPQGPRDQFDIRSVCVSRARDKFQELSQLEGRRDRE